MLCLMLNKLFLLWMQMKELNKPLNQFKILLLSFLKSKNYLHYFMNIHFFNLLTKVYFIKLNDSKLH